MPTVFFGTLKQFCKIDCEFDPISDLFSILAKEIGTKGQLILKASAKFFI